MTVALRYDRTYRRTLLDMHIPDWDPEFLAQHNPERLAELYAASISRESSSTVNPTWASTTGPRRWVASIPRRPSVTSSTRWSTRRARDIAPAAYYSVIFDNWAVESHPEWASCLLQPSTARTSRCSVLATAPRV